MHPRVCCAASGWDNCFHPSQGLNHCLPVQHELLQRLAPLLEEPMHPRDCCAASGWDGRPAADPAKPLPLSRRASAASHEDLRHLINQVLSPLHF